MAMPDAVCNLHTGLQGHGKTLLTLKHVEELRLSSKRDVYYSGIRDLKLDWTQFGGDSPNPEKPWETDPSEWYKLPAGAIIVIDEAQRLFRPRGTGSNVPPYEQALETLRHNGHTLFLITQDPTQVSTHVRRLCGVHRHFMRKFGSRWTTMHEWAGVRDNVSKTRKDSLESQLVHPKAFFDKYTSAEVHTVKFKVPLKVWLVLLLPVILGVCVWWTFWGRYQRDAARSSPTPASTPGVIEKAPPMAANGPARSRPRSADDLYASMQPRIVGLPYTAPRYDALTEPVRVPVIVGCWMDEADGWCITQQGTRVRPPKAFMASFIQSGSFLDIEPGPQVGEQRQAQRAGGGTRLSGNGPM